MRGARLADARATIDPTATLGAIDRRLFGSFVEHLGRCVYDGIYEPGHPDRRRATASAATCSSSSASWASPIVRYPGGNFVSGYDWEDGVGPRRERPAPARPRLAVASRPTSSAPTSSSPGRGAAGIEPMLAVNLGTRGVDEARDLVEYCNHPGGTPLRRPARAPTATRQPYGVQLWCLGNEMDGPWQIGHKTADEYGRLAAEAGKAMRRSTRRIELVACGSSGAGMPTFGAWERDRARALPTTSSTTSRCTPTTSEPTTTVAASWPARRHGPVHRGRRRDRRRTSRRAGGSDKRIELSFDEWNVWYPRSHGPRARQKPGWPSGAAAAGRGRSTTWTTRWSSAAC